MIKLNNHFAKFFLLSRYNIQILEIILFAKLLLWISSSIFSFPSFISYIHCLLNYFLFFVVIATIINLIILHKSHFIHLFNFSIDRNKSKYLLYSFIKMLFFLYFSISFFYSSPVFYINIINSLGIIFFHFFIGYQSFKWIQFKNKPFCTIEKLFLAIISTISLISILSYIKFILFQIKLYFPSETQNFIFNQIKVSLLFPLLTGVLFLLTTFLIFYRLFKLKEFEISNFILCSILIFVYEILFILVYFYHFQITFQVISINAILSNFSPLIVYNLLFIGILFYSFYFWEEKNSLLVLLLITSLFITTTQGLKTTTIIIIFIAFKQYFQNINHKMLHS